MMKKRDQFLVDTKGRPPAKTLEMAVELQSDRRKPLQAVDMGCGAGNEALFLLSHGYKVFAFDENPNSKKMLESRSVEIKNAELLSAKTATFADVQFPKADLINASFALPFHGTNGFDQLWKKIYDNLENEGIFAGQLFGIEDSWKDERQLYFVTAEQVLDMCSPYSIEHMDEVKRMGQTANGKPKFWHVFHLVLKKGI